MSRSRNERATASKRSRWLASSTETMWSKARCRSWESRITLSVKRKPPHSYCFNVLETAVLLMESSPVGLGCHSSEVASQLVEGLGNHLGAVAQLVGFVLVQRHGERLQDPLSADQAWQGHRDVAD